jgi:hypothetical protein
VYQIERHWGEGEPPHPILPEAHKWEIIGLRLEHDPIDAAEPYLDLSVRGGADRRVLRFWSPVDLCIEEGGPRMTHWLGILDMRSRQLDGIGIRVDDFEGSFGSVRFSARAVEQIEAKAG